MVRLATLLILFLCTNLFAVGSDEINRSFQHGVDLYKEGKYMQSAIEFKKLVDKNIVSGNIYFNLGNAYFKTGDLAKARLYYERAQKFNPRDTDLKGNINYLKQKLEDKTDVPDINIFMKIYGFAGFLFNENELSVITISVFLIVMVFWFLHILTGYSYRWVKWVLILFAGCFIWIASVFVLHKTGNLVPDYAIIIPDEAPVRWGDTDEDKIAFYLHKGTKVIVRQIRENWYLITIGQGKSGWIKTAQAQII